MGKAEEDETRADAKKASAREVGQPNSEKDAQQSKAASFLAEKEKERRVETTPERSVEKLPQRSVEQKERSVEKKPAGGKVEGKGKWDAEAAASAGKP